MENVLPVFSNKFKVFPTYEPMAVFNKTFEEWVNKTLEQCILDGKERECHFFDDDIIDHPIVSRKKNRFSWYIGR